MKGTDRTGLQSIKRAAPRSVEEYMSRFPVQSRAALRELRALIREAAPGAKERISYGMPAFALNGILVWFAAHRKHLGFYPKASGIAAFESQLAKYKVSKGTVQFPLGKPLPGRLIRRIVRFRAAENMRAAKKKTARP
jgi:uncharacterized protein YdhG (YjbR/CyaY superfamily)